MSKAEFYSSPQQEKILRANLKSNVEKHIDAEAFVIIDSMNYIKGYRYELHCMVRTTKTRQASIYCDMNKELAQKINEA